MLAILCLTVASCGGKKTEVKKVDSPGSLYIEGLAFMKKKNYEKAIASFSKVRENYPFDPIALVAQIKQADANFDKKSYAAAAGIYEDFVNSYPEDENAAYALRRLAECYEKTSPSIERDQANTFKALERFTFLKNRYPDSPYAKDADVHLANLTQKLAAREFYVGEFYLKYGKYNASIMRLEYFLEKYPKAKDRDKALYYLAQDYRELQNPEKAQSYLDRLKKEYPNGTYGRSVKRERKTLQVAAANPTVGGDGKAPTARPADFSYEEQKVRQIDLRPEETQKGGETEAKASESPKGSVQAPAGGPGGSSQARAGGQEARKTATAARQEAPAAAGAASDGEKQQSKKTGDKKDSLGFFSEKKPVDVVADTMEGLEKGKIIVFKGNVIAKQVDLYLFSDMLTAYINEETNEIDRAKAEGNVKIVKLDRTATCKEAFFYNDKGEIILQGDVVVFSGNDRVSGNTVTYYINEDRVHVEGEKDKRAKALITPK